MSLTRRHALLAVAGVAGLAILPGGVSACRRAPVPVEASPTPTTPIRDIRVLVLSNADRLRVRTLTAMTAVDAEGRSTEIATRGDWVTVSAGNSPSIKIGPSEISGKSVSLRSTGSDVLEVSVRSSDGWGEPRHYPGRFRLELGDDNRMRAINALDVERYVACVVAWEAWPTFRMAALRAQAVAARTFALYQMQQRNQSSYDMSATQAAQVYRGVRDGDPGERAGLAVGQTRGVVCTWGEGDREQMFPTYYSAACGGSSQSAKIFGTQSDVPPLSGGVKCDFCKIAPGETYRWGPVRISLAQLRSKLRSRFPSLSSITRIDVAERTPAGRPVMLQITDASGASYDIQAERLRHALGASRIRSTDFHIAVERDAVVFRNGKGFGHGLGFCQWGAQGQALKGKEAADILRFYYPGSNLARAY